MIHDELEILLMIEDKQLQFVTNTGPQKKKKSGNVLAHE